MELESFGSILGFAAEMEKTDQDFYQALTDNTDVAEYKVLFTGFARDEKKNEKTILRARRENVTEMILEPVRDFSSDSFEISREDAMGMNAGDMLKKALDVETAAEAFYVKASDKLKSMTEVSRILKRTAKKRSANRAQLEKLIPAKQED